MGREITGPTVRPGNPLLYGGDVGRVGKVDVENEVEPDQGVDVEPCCPHSDLFVGRDARARNRTESLE